MVLIISSAEVSKYSDVLFTWIHVASEKIVSNAQFEWSTWSSLCKFRCIKHVSLEKSKENLAIQWMLANTSLQLNVQFLFHNDFIWLVELFFSNRFTYHWARKIIACVSHILFLLFSFSFSISPHLSVCEAKEKRKTKFMQCSMLLRHSKPHKTYFHSEKEY